MVTVMVNPANAPVPPLPSDTETTIAALVPRLAAVGVPAIVCVPALKLSQLGKPDTDQVKVSPSASVAVGVNEYAAPGARLVNGLPLTTGERLVVAGAVTTIVNAGSDTEDLPSLTLIVIPAKVPAVGGVPDNTCVVVLKVAQLGTLSALQVNASLSASVAVGVKL